MVPSSTPRLIHSRASHRIWWFAFGYFASYVPYTFLTKDVTGGTADHGAIPGNAVLPLATFASMLGMFVFITAKGWWRYAARGQLLGRTVPRPRMVTLLSGLSTSAIFTTTTLAYTFDGISIIFAMLLMRGGLILLGPIVDKAAGRPFRVIPWYAWGGSALALAALFVGFAEDGGSELSVAAAVDIAIYLLAYFFRLRWMTKYAKRGSKEDDVAFFVEEQMVATPAAFLVLSLLAATLDNKLGADLAWGFIAIWQDPVTVAMVILIGLSSQGTGIFGALILLEPQDNAFTVPVNRASSVLAGLTASLLLHLVLGRPMPSDYELAGAGIIVAAILVLAWPSLARAFARPALGAAGTK
jgi:hypothetical protein